MRNKWFKKVISLAVTLAIIIVFTPANSTFAAPPANTDNMVAVLVSFKHKPGPTEQALIEGAGGKVKRTYHIIPTVAVTIPKNRLDSLRKNPNVTLVEEDATVHATGKLLPWGASKLDVKLVRPTNKGAEEKIVKQNGTVTLPADTAQITLLSGSQVLPWGVDRIDAELVHPTNKGAGIKVAVLDTGIDLSHPDLVVAGNVTFVAGTSNGNDDNGHGTIVAGIIGARDNDIGVIGVAPEAALYSVKVLDHNGGGYVSDVISGIQWAVDNGMQIINMSFGGGGTNGYDAEALALQSAYAAGLVLIAGANDSGNPGGTGNNIWAPALNRAVIAVGSTDNTDTRYSTSSTGYDLEVMAPGVNIYSTAMGGGYGYMTGTSAASAHASGEAALLIKSGLTNNIDVRRRLRDSATDLGAAGWDTQYGKGLINAYAAVNFSEPPDKEAPLTTISLSGTAGNNLYYISNVQVTLNVVDYGGSGVAQTQYSLDLGQTWNVFTGPFLVTTEGESRVIARSWDNAGNDEGPGDWQWFRIDKTPPTITLVVSPTTIKRGPKGSMYTITYNGTMQDSYSGIAGDNVTDVDEYGVYSWNLGYLLNGQVSVEKWCTANDTDGRHYTFRLTAADAAGNVAWVEATSTVYFR